MLQRVNRGIILTLTHTINQQATTFNFNSHTVNSTKSMEASPTLSPPLPTPSKPPPPDTPTDKIIHTLLKNNIHPTPKIIHTLRKKHLQKSHRKSKKNFPQPSLTDSQTLALAEHSHFQTIRREYKTLNKTLDSTDVLMVGRPWERLEKIGLREMSNASGECVGEKLKVEHLVDLGEILDERKRDELRWLLDDDVEVEEGWIETGTKAWEPRKRRGGEVDAIRFLVDRLGAKELNPKDWKFGRMMKQSELQFTEAQLLKIVGRLGETGQWRNALSVVEWAYGNKELKVFKSRFVYTKLLSILGKARRPHEALHIFNLMRADFHVYPDIAAYHSISVTLGQSGLLKELVKIIESLRQKPSTEINNMRRKKWDPIMEPDLVVYNAVLNACVPTRQWKGVSWVFEQLRKSSLKPNGASYGLAMEVMLQSGRYDHVHEFFRKMRRSGEAPKALTYKVLVRAFWKEGKVDEAVEAVRSMEQRGVVGTACVYYELACCLCNKGKWQDAMIEVEKLKKLPHAKPLEVTFTGMIMSALDGGYVDDCITIFEQMKYNCTPNIGTINAMLKVYGRVDMFSEAKELFEETKRANCASENGIDDNSDTSLVPDLYTYSLMLDTSAIALQWEYFEHVYKDMALCGYQLDLNKHGELLVKASKAGKCHLLEHAFDTTLEAGEIPPPSFFTEMICQATCQCNYERALNLINALAHAPFQVTEKQWTDLFQRNRDRISRDRFEKLSDVLVNSPIKEEPTMKNLTKSLRSFCATGGLKVLSNTSTLDESNKKSYGIREINERNPSATMVGGNSNSHDITFYLSSIDYADGDDEDVTNMEAFSNTSTETLLRDDSKNDDSEWELDIRVNNADVSNGSNYPSADTILEAWKESMDKDSISSPFQN